MLLGFSPDFLAGTNWVLSTVISALLGILVAGNQHTVDPLTITLLVIPHSALRSSETSPRSASPPRRRSAWR